MADFLSQYGGVIGLLIGLMVLVGAPLFKGAKAAASFIATRFPKRPSFSFGSLLSAKFEIEYWKLLLLCLALWLIAGGGGLKLPGWPSWRWPSIVPGKPMVILMHEAEHGPLPPYAIGAARELEAAGFEVRVADDDEVTGTGDTPAWLKPALEPGRKIMGGTDDASQKNDALVLLRGERVTKAVKLPTTREAIVGECK